HLTWCLFSNRRRHTRSKRDWCSDVCSSDLKFLLGFMLFFGLSFICLTIAMKSISMSTSYAVWTGIGAVGGALLGIIFYGESKNIKRILFIGIILASTIGLK